MTVNKWENVDRTKTVRIDTRSSGTIQVPNGMVAVVNGLIRYERTIVVREGDRVDLARRP